MFVWSASRRWAVPLISTVAIEETRPSCRWPPGRIRTGTGSEGSARSTTAPPGISEMARTWWPAAATRNGGGRSPPGASDAVWAGLAGWVMLNTCRPEGPAATTA